MERREPGHNEAPGLRRPPSIEEDLARALAGTLRAHDAVDRLVEHDIEEARRAAPALRAALDALTRLNRRIERENP